MGIIKTTWDRLIHLGLADLPDRDQQKRISLGVNKMAAFVVMINSTLGFACCFLAKDVSLFGGVAAEIALMAIPLVCNYHKKYWWGSMSMFLVMSLATLFFCCVLGKLAEAQLTVIYLLGLSRFVFADKRSRILCTAITIAIIIGIELNFEFVFIAPVKMGAIANYVVRGSAYAVVIFLVIYTFNLFSKANRYLFDKLQIYADQVEANLEKEAEENRIKDKFIGNATHEVRVSFFAISSIINHLYSIEQKINKKQFKKGIDDLQAACKYSQTIFDNILAYEKYQAKLPNQTQDQLVNLDILLASIVGIYNYMAESRDIVIDCHIAEELEGGYVVTDELKLRQIVTNLLDNAVKFTDNRSIVTVEASQQDNQLVISIQDQGCGIDEASLPNIFKPFVTRNPDGLGLGLFIVHELTEVLGGKIAAVNRPEGGAVFTVTLPVKIKNLAIEQAI